MHKASDGHDPHSAVETGDSPFAARPYSLQILLVEFEKLETLTRYASDTGRTAMVIAATNWESTDAGRTTLTHRLFISADAFSERETR